MKRHDYWIIILSAVIIIVMGLQNSFAAGDVVSGVVNVSNPGLVQKNLQNNPQKQKSLPSNLVEQKKMAPSAPPGFEKIHFKLAKVILKGNTLYPTNELLAIFAPSINHTISLADFQGMVDEITKKYRSAGYILSHAIIPPQVINHGVITVQIIEGFISEVVVEGDVGPTKTLLEKYGQRITRLRPFQISYLERYMLLMNDLPGMIVKSVISPSKTVPAGARLELVAQRQKLQWSVSYDNYGTRYLGPQEIGVRAQLNSLFMAGDSNSFRYVTVPHMTEMNYMEFVHTNPIGSNGLRYTLGGNYTNTHPLFVLSPFDIVGHNIYLYTDLTYPLLRTRSADIYVHATFDYQNVVSTLLSTLFYIDRMRPLNIGVNLDGVDKWQGVNTLGASIEHGFNIMGANQHFLQSRPLGVSNYTKAMLNASRIQWINERFSLYGAFTGQYSCNPLLASAQFAYGGPDFGRGYDPSEIVADEALAAKMELRMNSALGWKYLNEMQYYAFYDGGILWNRDGVNQLPKQSATSTGLGARFYFIPQLYGNFYVAYPLTHNVGVFEVIGDNRRPVRTFFQLVLSV
jgi:hemolysin activation/secretion protein